MNSLFSSIRFLQTQPDLRLVTLARAGHERAFEALIKRYRAPLLAYCRRIAPSHASAEDALQEALLQAWVALRADAEVRDTRAWLYSIVHNITVSKLRTSGHPPAALTEVNASRGADEEAEQRMEALTRWPASLRSPSCSAT
jgi:RNA polymerase sigma factor (sigma-70 family)